LLVSKFVPGLNTVASPFAGMAGVGLNQFVAVDVIGSLAYAACCIGVGYFFSGQVAQIGAAFAHYGGHALRVLLGLVLLYIVYKFWQRQRLLRKLRMARITVEDLHQRMEAGEKPVILDLRSTAELKANPSIIRGAVHVDLNELAAYRDQLPRDQDIVAYCSCPNEFTAAHTAMLLKKNGFTRIRPLLGGIDAWRRQNYPLSAWPVAATAPAPDSRIELVENSMENQPN
jgi:rhodanese-related sulfurtransferase